MLKRFVLIVFSLLILLPLLMYLIWLLKPATQFNVLILDKTVLTTSVQEHVSLSWILKHAKYTHSDSGLYRPSKDYFGFFPDDKGSYTIKDFNNSTNPELQKLAETYDMVYYTDLYGMYSSEWIATYFPKRINDPRFISQRSQLYYGGLTQTELNLLQLFKQKRKLIINEFNIIAHPTAYTVRRAYEKEFHLKWSGWVGRYFSSLDTLTNLDLPRWLIDNYIHQHEGKWPFKHSGIAFVREDDKVEILENKTHLNIEIPYVHTSEDVADKYNVAEKIKYPFWFDIILVNDTLNTVLSEYRIDSNTRGDSLLQELKLPKTFPAAICSKDELYFYLCGDFCDYPVGLKSASFQGIEWFSFITASGEKTERVTFFWKYYRPLISKVLDNYNKSKK